MTCGAVDLVLRVALGGHLGRVGHAEEDAARSLESPDGNGIARRDEILVKQRAIGDAPTLDPGRVLDRIGHAQDRPIEPLLATRIDGIGSRARLGRIEVDNGREAGIACLDTGDCHLGNVARPELARAYGIRDGGGTLIEQFGHHVFPQPELTPSMIRCAAMSLESDLYAPVKTLLEGQGYSVKGEIRGCDVVGIRGDEPPVIVELKRTFGLGLVLQGVDRLALSDIVYLAIGAWPKNMRNVKKLCRRLGLD